MAIHPDVARGATAINQAAQVAEQHGQLATALPDVVVLMSLGLMLALRDLQLLVISQELER